MSAITTHEEDAGLAGTSKRGCLGCAGRSRGLGALGTVAPARRSLEMTHANLTRSIWIRRMIERALADKQVRLMLGPTGSGELELVFAGGKRQAISPGLVPYSPSVGDGFWHFSLWGMSGKMGCPTWDFPSGSPKVGGSCPASTAGQTIVEPRERMGLLTKSGGRLFLKEKMPGFNLERPLPNGGRVEYFEGDEPREPWKMPICQECVTGDTRVLVRGRGLVAIEDLVDEAEVEVWSGKGWRKTHAVCNGPKPTVKLTTSWGAQVRLTADHKVLTQDGMVEAQDVAGLALVHELPPDVAFPPCADLPFDVPQYRSSVEDNFPRKWSYDVGVLLGYVLGNGTVSKGKYPTVSICSAEDDVEELVRLRDTVASWCSTRSEVSIRPVKPNAFCTNPKNQATISWRVQGLVRLLLAAGLDKSVPADSRRAPAGIWEASEPAVAGFLSGLFSTDGCVSVGDNRVEISLSSVSRGLLEDVQQLLFVFGIRSTICAYYNTADRARQGWYQLWKLNIGSIAAVRRFREVVGFFREVKRQKLEDALAGIDAEPAVRRPVCASIEPTGRVELVYDLVNVGEEHQFVANGISVSNCYAGGGHYGELNVAIGNIVRYYWTASLMKTTEGQQYWIDAVVESMKLLDWYPVEQKGIKPVRVHSSGDFFTPAYMAAWIEVANRMARIDPSILFWAPTRSWASPDIAPYWRKALDKLQQPNFVVRCSAFHMGDHAPGALHPANAVGTTAVFRDDNKGDGTDPRFDRTCPVYSKVDEGHTCQSARDPITGLPGCRMCWTAPRTRVNFTVHI